jgi:hypothetical protein
MNLQIYKPNSKNTGCAASFQISQKPGQEPQCYVNCIAQHSWDDQKKNGSFAESRNNPSKTIAVKFNEFELGEFINAFQQKTAYSTFHSSEASKTQIKISPYEKTKGTGEYAVKYTAFGFSLTRNGSDAFKIPLEPGEFVRLNAFINKFFSLLDEFRKPVAKTEQKSAATVAPKQVKAQEPAVESEEVEF